VEINSNTVGCYFCGAKPGQMCFITHANGRTSPRSILHAARSKDILKKKRVACNNGGVPS
jgi:hypothetical protein